MCYILTLISCSSVVKIDRLDLSIPNRMIDDIIQNPDTLVFYHMQDNFTNRTYEEMKDLQSTVISILKTEYDGEYRFTQSLLYNTIPSSQEKYCIELTNKNLNHHYDIMMNSLKSGRDLTFHFYCKNGSWFLGDLNSLKPRESTYAYSESEKKISTLSKEDNCQPYIEEVYIQIESLLKNGDSLYNIYHKIVKITDYNKDYLCSSENFNDYLESFKDGSFLEIDEIFEADENLKKFGITILNRISLYSFDGKTFIFYFMKKDGVWQFYDRKLENFPEFP